jgi:ABC-2 type transport system permease protein
MTGVGTLTRLALRTERFRIPVWVLGTVLLPLVTFNSYAVLFPTAESRATLVSLANTPAFQVIIGQPGDLTTAGGFTAWRTLVVLCVLASILSILIVIRHTRAEEDAGRAELLAGAPLARSAWPMAATVVAAATAIVTGGATALLLIASGATPTDSLVMGAAIAACGFAFGSIALVAAQVASSARVALGASIVVLAGSFMLRGWADADPTMDWLAWTNPLGWAERVRPFGEINPAPLVFLLLAGAAFTALALVIDERRDLGRGLVSERPGPEAASHRLRSPLSLAWRIQRGSLIGWTIGLITLGVVYGTVQGSIATTLGNNPMFERLMGSQGADSFVDAFIAAVVSVLAIFATGFGVSAILRMRSEEADGRAELLLSASVRRPTWFGSHVTVALLGSVWLILMGVAGFAFGALISGSSTTPATLIGAAAGQVPAVAVLAGVAALLIGLRPRLAPIAWAVFAFSAVMAFFGPLLDLPAIVVQASPFTHLPQLPQEAAVFAPYAVLSTIALALIGLGLVMLRDRDVPST